MTALRCAVKHLVRVQVPAARYGAPGAPYQAGRGLIL